MVTNNSTNNQDIKGDSGTALGYPITVAGGSNMSTAATGSTVTVNLVNSPSVSGSVTAGTGLTATTGNVSISAGNLNLPNTNSAFSQGVINMGGAQYFNNYGTDNLFIGGAGNGTLTTANAQFNVGIGINVLSSLTTGSTNLGLGYGALSSLNTGSNNSCWGYLSGWQISSGSNNVGFGTDSLANLLTGSANISIGYLSGLNYTGAESSNILIGNAGTLNESNVIHIGTQGTSSGQQNACYIAGVSGVSVSNTNMVTINTSTGQLGSQAVPLGAVTSVTGTANQILASPTTGAVVLSLIGPYTPATYASHALLVGAGTSSIGTVAAVAAGQVLVSAGTGSDPAYSATPSVTSITLGAGNTLSTYVQGTFTPGIAFGGGTTGITYSVQTGQYTQIGNVLYFYVIITMTNKGSSTGNATLTGLPIATASTGQRQWFANTNNFSYSTNFIALTWSTTAAATELALFQFSPTQVGAFATNANFANNTQLVGEGFYFV